MKEMKNISEEFRGLVYGEASQNSIPEGDFADNIYDDIQEATSERRADLEMHFNQIDDENDIDQKADRSISRAFYKLDDTFDQDVRKYADGIDRLIRSEDKRAARKPANEDSINESLIIGDKMDEQIYQFLFNAFLGFQNQDQSTFKIVVTEFKSVAEDIITGIDDDGNKESNSIEDLTDDMNIFLHKLGTAISKIKIGKLG